MSEEARTVEASTLGDLMYGLLYPAVLGTMFYSLLPVLAGLIGAGEPLTYELQGKLAAGALIVIHYVVDYVCARRFTPDGMARRLSAFILDLGVIFFLFLSFDSLGIDRDGGIEIKQAALYLSISYFLFILWGIINWKNLTERLKWWVLGIEVLGLGWFIYVATMDSASLGSLLTGLSVLSLLLAGMGYLLAAEWKRRAAVVER